MDSTEASLDSVHPLAQSKPPTQDPTYQPKLKPPLPAPNPPHSHRHPSSSAHFHTPDPHPALHPIPYPTLPSPPPKLSAPTLLSPSQPPNPTSTVSSRPPPALPIQSHPAHQTTTPPVQSSPAPPSNSPLSSSSLFPSLPFPTPHPRARKKQVASPKVPRYVHTVRLTRCCCYCAALRSRDVCVAPGGNPADARPRALPPRRRARAYRAGPIPMLVLVAGAETVIQLGGFGLALASHPIPSQVRFRASAALSSGAATKSRMGRW